MKRSQRLDLSSKLLHLAFHPRSLPAEKPQTSHVTPARELTGRGSYGATSGGAAHGHRRGVSRSAADVRYTWSIASACVASSLSTLEGALGEQVVPQALVELHVADLDGCPRVGRRRLDVDAVGDQDRTHGSDVALANPLGGSWVAIE